MRPCSLRPLGRIFLSVTALVAPQPAFATNILWDGTGSSWNLVNPWSLFSNAITPNPAAKPGASDTAIFNIETVNTAQTVNLDAAQSALGLSFNSTGAVTIQTGAGTNTLTLGSGGIAKNAGSGAATISSGVGLSAPQSWVNSSNSNLVISGTLTHGNHNLTIDGTGPTIVNGAFSAGNPKIIKNGAGTLTLNGTNTDASADLLINAGSVRIANPLALAALADSDVVFGAGSTGSLNLGGNSITLRTLSTDAVVGTPVVENIGGAPATFTVNNILTTPTTFAGVIRNGVSGGAVGLRVMGPMILSGDNQHTGITEVKNVLTLGHANALGSTVGGTIVDANGDLDLRGLAIGTETLTVKSGAVLRNTSVTPASWAGNILFDNTTDNSFTVDGIADMTLSGQILGDGSQMALVKAGANTLELTGSANNTAPLTVTDGILRLAKSSSAAIHAVESTTTVAGGTLQLAGTGGDQIANAVDVNSGSFDTNGRNEQLTALELSGSGVGGIGALVNTASNDSVLSISPSPFGPQIRIVTFARIGVTQSGANLTLASDFSGVDDGDMQKVGLGTLILTGNNSAYSGDVFLTAGAIAVGSNTALGTGLLTIDGGTLRSDGGARIVSNLVAVGTSAAVSGNLDLTFAGAISGTGALAKGGSGRLTLSAVSSYSGTATVNAGTLAVNGSIVGNVSVNTGGILAGLGTIGGMVTLNTGAALTPGDSAGELTVGALTMSSGSTLSMEIGGTAPGTQYDQLTASETLSLAGQLEVVLANSFAPTAGNSFDLLDWTSLAGTFSSLNLPALTAGLAWNTSQLYTSGILSIAHAGVSGDYNNNGTVDAGDYVLWRKGGLLANEVDTPGTNNSVDYAAWRARFGNPSSGSGAGGAANTAVPEPSTLALLTLAVAGACLRPYRLVCTTCKLRGDTPPHAIRF